ncbi:MAG: Fic family protein [Bacteroidota bacterium]
MEKEITIWEPINFADNWLSANTSKLDELAPSWFKKRELLKEGSKEYEEFVNRLKRQHAIETGIVEKLYDLKEGITQTFIKEGFVESYLQHGDTNIPPRQLIAYLTDHFDAIDFVFDVVKQNRQITKGFILELHQLITQHQDTTDAIDTLGNIVKVALLKGQFKKHENNPKRNDGTIFLYCPPLQVDSEIDKLISILSELEANKTKPIIIAAWVHHAFTQIHPFQDGNGRLARLLASLILIKHGLFPFTVKGSEKKKYIDSLELADSKLPQSLIDYFCEVEKRNIEDVLNLKLDIPISNATLDEVTDVFSQKLTNWKHNLHKEKINKINNNRNQIFQICTTILDETITELHRKISSDMADIYIDKSLPESTNYFWFTHQIVDYAKMHDYFFNRTLPRGWFKLAFVLSAERQYQLVISIHHFGYDNSTVAVGAFLEFIESKNYDKNSGRLGVASSRKGQNNNLITSLPLNVKPHIVSLEADTKDLELNLKSFLQDTVTVTLAQIASEIS